MDLNKVIETATVETIDGAIVSVSYNKGLAFDAWTEINKENK